jgi:predicted enzyme related to lactoylglutathione lyase
VGGVHNKKIYEYDGIKSFIKCSEVRQMPSIVHFEIPADDIQRAKTFYSDLFGWRMESMPGMDYTMIDTFGAPGGGMMKRMHPEQQIISYIGVPSVDEYAAKAEKLGGKIIVPKMAVPGMGYFVVCLDTENNAFGIWEMDMKAKE